VFKSYLVAHNQCIILLVYSGKCEYFNSSIIAQSFAICSFDYLFDHLARWEHEMTTARWSRAQVGGPSVIPTVGIHYKLRCLLTWV